MVTWDREFRTLCDSVEECGDVIREWCERWPSGHHPPRVYKSMHVDADYNVSESWRVMYIVHIDYWTTDVRERREL